MQWKHLLTLALLGVLAMFIGPQEAQATIPCDECWPKYEEKTMECEDYDDPDRPCELAGKIMGWSFGLAAGIACVPIGATTGPGGATICAVGAVVIGGVAAELGEAICDNGTYRRCMDGAEAWLDECDSDCTVS